MSATTGEDRYLELVRQFPLRPIRSDDGLARAIAALNALVSRRGPLSPEEEDYIEVLGRLVKDYEDATDPLPELSGVETLRALLEVNDMTQVRLAEETGIAVATISEILNGKRSISPKVRQTLAKRFGVAPAYFV